jgi:ubiquinone/menaquinone biosynthesis C-methylase UbiE
LVPQGFDYVGVDLAAPALSKAKERLEASLGDRGDTSRVTLVQHDVTDLSFLEPQSFDLAIDAKLLHMLVVDSDRDRYLRGLSRALKPGAMVLFIELFREDAYDGPMDSFDEYMNLFAPDLTTLEERSAFNAGKEVKIKLAQVPARPRSKAGYLSELGRYGFEVLTFTVLESGMECRIIAQYS